MSRRAAIAVAAAAAMAVGAAAVVAALFVLPAPEPPLLIDADDAALVEAGRAIYAAHCASCHGPNLEGQPDWQRRDADGLLPAPPHDHSGHSWHHSDQVLFDITKFGPAAFEPGYATAMPAFADVLGDRDILAVIAFIKSRWPEEIRARQAAVTRAESHR